MTPVAPTVTQAVCRGGVLVPPTLTLPTTDGITYTRRSPIGPYAQGQSVTVTATLDGAGVAGLIVVAAGWIETSTDDGDV